MRRDNEIDNIQSKSISRIISDSMNLTDEFRKSWNGLPYMEESTGLNSSPKTIPDITPVSETENQTVNQADTTTTAINSNSMITSGSSFKLEVSTKRLQEAVIWSEILGKPVTKHRKRRWYAN